MGCTSCGEGSCSTTPNGCKSNGGCATGGCNKLNTYDWFGNMLSPHQSEKEAIYEIRFKNTHKNFYQNTNGLQLIVGDFVVVESDRGHNVGVVSLGGIMAQLQLKKKKIKPSSEKIKTIHRIASEEDVEKLKTARSREHSTLIRSREIVKSLKLEMKLSDVEFQGDNTKAIFYYIAENRVDFRTLIRSLADEFKIRVEMKQIGLRHEAGLVGGIGSCGRELCCSTWLTDFKAVSTSAARYQNISLNPMKISGNCGRLKCCLNYELDTYMDALKDIPKRDKIATEAGMAFLQKTDIFKEIMWFTYADSSNWIPLEIETFEKLLAMEKEGKKISSLTDFAIVEEVPEAEAFDFVDVVGHTVLPAEKGRRKKKRNNNSGKSRGKNNPQDKGRNERSANDKNPKVKGRTERNPKAKGPVVKSKTESPPQKKKPNTKSSEEERETKNQNSGRKPSTRGNKPQKRVKREITLVKPNDKKKED